MPDLNKLIDWVKAGNGKRNVSIEIGDVDNSNRLKIWVYDYDLDVGQHVNSVDEINLNAAKENEEREQYKRLKEKYGE